jgi:hypothetical protein
MYCTIISIRLLERKTVSTKLIALRKETFIETSAMLQQSETVSLWNWAGKVPIVHPPDDTWVNMDQQQCNDTDLCVRGINKTYFS